MRSSESANIAQMQISVRIRCLLGNTQIEASASSQNAISRSDQRARRVRKPVTSAASGGESAASAIASPRRRAREQPLRAPQQHDDHDAVDDEGAERGQIIFAGDVADAEQDRGDERARDAGGAADRDDDEKVDEVLEREDRIEAEDLRAERAAERSEPGAEREGETEHCADIDAEPARDALVVDRGAQPAAEPGLGQDEVQRDGEQAAQDEE